MQTIAVTLNLEHFNTNEASMALKVIVEASVKLFLFFSRNRRIRKVCTNYQLVAPSTWRGSFSSSATASYRSRMQSGTVLSLLVLSCTSLPSASTFLVQQPIFLCSLLVKQWNNYVPSTIFVATGDCGRGCEGCTVTSAFNVLFGYVVLIGIKFFCRVYH